MALKVLISDPVEKVCTEILQSNGIEVDNKPGIPADELKAIIKQYDALIVRSGTQVTTEVIAAADNLKVIGRAGAGVDNIDVEAASRRGIIVLNTPGGNTISTAEHTMSMLLSLSRNIPQAYASLQAGKWERKIFVGTELDGKTIGIVGLGKIGREVAARCQAFGMKTIGYDPVLSPDVAAKLNIECVSLGEIFKQSDFITVHTPLNDETRHLISDAQLAQCRDGVRLVNCARGGIVDEAALLRGLESGKVAGAAFDVFVAEPPTGHPLLKHPKFIATPHLGASTEEAQEKVAKLIGEQVADALQQKNINGAVNAEVMQQAMKKELQPFVHLAEKLGSLQAQLMVGNLRKIQVTCSGDLLIHAMDVLVSAVLKGVLSRMMAAPVNLVNARVIGRDLGIRIESKIAAASGSYTNLVELAYETDAESRSFTGTVFGNGLARFVRIDDFYMEVVPEGFLLFYSNVDRPGRLAKVGAELATANVNIAGLALGRDLPGSRALTIINVDSVIPEDVLRRVEKIEGVSEVKLVRL